MNINAVIAVILAVVGAVVYLFLNVVIRRMVAGVRSREDYDEDVDGKMTKAERKAFEESKAIEEKKKNISFDEVRQEYGVRFYITAILGAVLGALAGAFFGLTPETIINFIFFGVLVIIAFIDMDTMEIPPVLNLIILGLGIISFLLDLTGIRDSGLTIVDRLIGAVCVSGFLLLVAFLVDGAFGGGDIKLMVAAGFLLGWKSVLTAFLVGLFVGASIGIVLLIRRKKGRKEHMPFGPSLCVGLIVTAFIGHQLVDWYLNMVKSMMPNTYGQ